MRPASLEEVGQGCDPVGDVDPSVAVGIQSRRAARRILAEEEVAEEGYGITDVDIRVLVEVSGDLASRCAVGGGGRCGMMPDTALLLLTANFGPASALR